MSDRIRTLITEKAIENRIVELAEEIKRDFTGETVTLVCILKGAVFFMVDLAKKLEMTVELDFMDISSYGDGTVSSGAIKINKDLDRSVEGKNVLLIEDIIDSGRTLSYVYKYLNGQKPKSLKLCTLLDKPDRRVVHDTKVDYIGFVIPDEFVIGYGLDYAQKYRNLPYIGVLDLDPANTEQ